MSTLSDRYSGVSGEVVPFLLLRDGTKTLLPKNHNMVLQASNGILARLLAGAKYAPTHIVFVSGTLTTEAPTVLSSYFDLTAGGAVCVSSLLTPTVEHTDKGYDQVVFTSHTGIGDKIGAFDERDVKRAILVSTADDGSYVPFSVYDFDDISVPAGAIFGVYWTLFISVPERLVIMVSSNGDNPDNPSVITGAGRYTPGDICTLSVDTTPSGRVFSQWLDATDNNQLSNANPYSFEVERDMHILCDFETQQS